MINKNVIIIGAGIAGLAAGCYLQMNGYDTKIFELHSLPGGCITSWKRKDYIIDGSIHGLVGSSPSHPLYNLWNEIIDMKSLQFFYGTELVIITKDKKKFTKFYDLEKLEHYMKNISPQDSKIIDEYIQDTKKLQKMNAFKMIVEKPNEFYNIFDYIKMLTMFPALGIMKKWQNMSSAAFASKFKNQFLREAVKGFLSPVLFDMLVLTTMDLKQAGYPIKGSLHFSKMFEKKYLELGGIIYYKSIVKKINTESDKKGNKAVGITLHNGKEYNSDIVISAGDGYSTLFQLLNNDYTYKKLTKIYEKEDLNPSMILISLGVNKKYDNVSQTYIINMNSPISIPDGNKYNHLKVRIFNFETPLKPEKKTIFITELLTKNFEYWYNLWQNNKDEYKKNKSQIADQIINILDEDFAQLKENIEMIDVSTPVTFYKYTNNWKGSTQGWANENIFKNMPIKKQLPGLKNFYMIGHWIIPGGGVPNAFLSGRTVAQIICKKDKKQFRH